MTLIDYVDSRFLNLEIHQTPYLCGNRIEHFLELYDRKGNSPEIIVVRKKDDISVLQGGGAHGICKEDLFTLQVQVSGHDGSICEVRTAVTRARALTSNLVIIDAESATIDFAWVAKPVTRQRLLKYPVRVSVGLPSGDEWTKALKARGLRPCAGD